MNDIKRERKRWQLCQGMIKKTCVVRELFIKNALVKSMNLNKIFHYNNKYREC